ncbi:MAG: hypothetical protein QXH51_07650 [Candidatus Bathyarchaeia archaeon]
MDGEEKITKILNIHHQPIFIKVLRDFRGKYGWEIEVYSEDELNALTMIDTIDNKLRVMFLGVMAPKPVSEAIRGKSANTTNPSTKILVEDGDVKVAEIITNSRETRIEFSKELEISPEHPAVKNFLINKYLKPLAEEQGSSISLEEDGGVLKMIKISPRLKRINVGEMEKKILWAIRKSSQKKGGGKN